MIKKAKVNLLAVKAFKQSVSEVKEYSNSFQNGLEVLDELIRWMTEVEKELEAEIEKMKSAKERLVSRIKEIEEKVASLTARVNELEEQLSDLESELASMDATITFTNSEGETSELPNPAYAMKEAEIAAVEMQLSGVRAELDLEQARLDRANSVYGKLESYIDEVNGTIYAIQEKQSITKRLKSEFSDAKSANTRKGNSAFEKLYGVEQAINKYLHARIEYENATASIGTGAPINGGGININININRGTVASGANASEQRPVYSEQEIKKHDIKFDDEKRVREFDDKKFGGKYNPFDTRIAQVPKDPIFGQYEGARGESKFIPSDKIAEGITVIGILKQYGLDGITYYNAEPDFEPCAEAVVKIKNMTENRYNYDNDSKLGNFSQADIECAKLWSFEEKDGKKKWAPRDVANYRLANGLTWHEKCDMETMVLVRGEINKYFGHSGGCSECKLRDSANSGGDFDE